MFHRGKPVPRNALTYGLSGLGWRVITLAPARRCLLRGRGRR